MTTSIRPAPQSFSQRSAFAAAFLTFVFPGLGHVYARAYKRALVFGALPLLALAEFTGQAIHLGVRDFALWVGQTAVLGPLAVANVVVLGYRVWATVDAYAVALDAGAAPEGGVDRTGSPRSARRFRLPHVPVNPLSLAGLAAILVVMAAGHVLAGYWDSRFLKLATDTHSPIVIAAETPDPSMGPAPSPAIAADVSLRPQPTPRPWNGQGRLNILLVGVDQQDNGFRTDSMIVASIDPTSHRVALFSMPRDTVGLQMPPNSPLSTLWGSTFNYKLNALWTYSDKYRTLFPGGGADALKQAMSYALFGTTNAIPYYILVNFSGFQNMIDALGGVTIDVPAPVVDNGYPGNGDGQHLRVNIPAGMQHMDGYDALTYARSRKGGGYYNDFNRSARQEQILVALEQQADLGAVSSHLSDLIDSLSDTIHTDLPEGPDVLGVLIDQARYVNVANIRTFAFGTSGYGGYITIGPPGDSISGFSPDIARIRDTVSAVTSPAASFAAPAVLTENAPIVVETGSGTTQEAAALVTKLQSMGLNAGIGDPGPSGEPTTLLVVNGADTAYPATLALLRETLGLNGPVSGNAAAPIQASSQPGQLVGYVIVLGSDAPAVTPSP
ncbi:MAG TPA: LCP family protein [Candidatus Limnocylindrales bacterium]